MTKQTEAMKLALEAMRGVIAWHIMRSHLVPYRVRDPLQEAITAISEALAEQPAQQEPVVFYRCNGCGHAYEQVHPTSCDCMEGSSFEKVNYYTSPPAQQEPVAWIVEDQSGERLEWAGDAHSCHGVPTFPLYTSPPAQRKPLTDEEIKELYGDDDNFRMTEKYVVAFARAIEAAHGIKENT